MDFGYKRIQKGGFDLYFVPEVQDDAVELKFSIQTEKKLKEKGFTVEKVSFSVGTSYSAVGEALSAGSADAGVEVDLVESECRFIENGGILVSRSVCTTFTNNQRHIDLS